MAVDKKTVERLATLAKLSFDEEEKAQITDDLNKMLAFVDQLNEINTEGVEPLIYMLDEQTPLREDQVIQSITQEDALTNAPEKDSDFIRVPKVLNN